MQHTLQTFKRSIWAPLTLIFVLALPGLWYSLTAAPALRLGVGEWPDDAFLSGVHEPERNADGSFRWTRDRAELTLPNLSGRYQLLRVRAQGWRPLGVAFPVVHVEVGGRPWASFQPTRDLRAYDIPLPRDDASANLHIAFVSDVYTAPTDRREVGFALDWIELRSIGVGGPSLGQFGGQALLLALALGLVGSLANTTAAQLTTKAPGHDDSGDFVRSFVPSRLRGKDATDQLKRDSKPYAIATVLGAALALGLIGANLIDPLWVAPAVGGWLLVVGGMLAATWLVRPSFRRWLAPWMPAGYADLAWALLVAAAALRLLGATLPIFDIHDLGFHTIWLDSVIKGELYIYSAPSEFQNRAIFNPPAGYLLMAPLELLVPTLRLSIQVGVALVDTLGCLLLLPLARELNLAPRAALIALALYAALPINTTMLWWGFATNDMAQTAGLLLMLALLRLARRPDGSRWGAFVAAVVACLLMHIGALVLAMALLSAAILFGWLRLAPQSRRAAIGGAALALALTGLLYFTAVVDPALARPSDVAAAAPQDTAVEVGLSFAARLGLATRAVAIGFVPLAAALAPLGFLQLVRRRPRGALGRPLMLGWLAASVSFFAVYLALGLLVRYVYFAAPLVCLSLGALLAGLWRRRGQIVVTAIVLLVVWSGVALWIMGVLFRIKPSLVPLTH